MTFDPARPRYDLSFAGKEYELFGTLELVETIEHAFQDGIVQLTSRVAGMGVTDTAKLVSAVLRANGHKLTQKEAGEVIFNTIGVQSTEFGLLQLHLYAFLRMVLEPPEMREKKAKQMGEMIGGWQRPPGSPGKSTRKSA
jgi:hypothetical protein